MYSQYVLLKTNSYIIRMNREDNLCWFHGKVPRDQAEQILKDEGIDGVFLVRESNTSSGDYVLSVMHKGEIWHYQIRRHGDDAFFSIDDQTPIHGLDSLIEHYQEASNGLVTQLSAIVKRDLPPHDSRSHGRTNLLHRATKEGDFRVVSELLTCGYRNIDAKNQDGQTAVHLACRIGDERIIRKLIESGANVNYVDTDGNTALHYACQNSSASVIRMLVDAKATIPARNNNTGWVPLHNAARYGNLAAVKELLQLGAPHLARTSDGLHPIDLAREYEHNGVIKYLEKFTPAVATVYKYQWYHGTLDRNESNRILLEYVKGSPDRFKLDTSNNENNNNNGDERTDRPDYNKLTPSFNTNGIFLVRYSEKHNQTVLTLLFEGKPRNFIIQNFGKYLYIDDGPFMTTLEHLVQHYMKFADGLPVNLRFAVPPKPKPPLPRFSTIPKINRSINKLPLTSPDHINRPRNSDKFPSVPRNLSIPNDSMLSDGSRTSPIGDHNQKSGKDRSSDILNFRSLKLRSPKKNIIDGMKTLTKKEKKSKRDDKRKSSERTSDVEEMSQGLKNLSFQSPAATTPTDTLYNVPKNNSAVVSVDIHSANSNRSLVTDYLEPDTNQNILDPPKDYFTERDDSLDDKDNSVEEIYFVDAPTINDVMPSESPPPPPPSTQPPQSIPSSNLQYVPFKNVPFFPDTAQINHFNNNIPPTTQQSQNLRLNRLESTTSTISTSTIGESPFNRQSICAARPNYFIPKDCLSLNEILGEGEFGSVYKGRMKCILELNEFVPICKTDSNPDDGLPVAIKTLHDEHCKENRAAFLREASVMIRLSHHCIVKLIGISKGPPLMMVQELVSLGSMLNYLLEHPDKVNANFELKVWASQIACGMNFLESHHFVHRDLAARNILLASQYQAKISDFGLSRALHTDNNYYQASQGGKWPIKWYAPESFNYGTFSHASDVWSFGVTLWEMFSLGEPPYGDMKGVDVIKLVELGKRLSKPVICPDNVFRVMENCWNYNPKDRPTFRHLTEFFSNDPDYQNVVELIKTEHIG